MKLHVVDLAIILAYVLVTVLIGFWISKRASKGIKHYFLGGNELPWWMLGVSNASGMFDISGTMLMVYWLFVYGLKSVWIPWLWPVFNQIFLMVYLSAWLRRSGVLTGAEWIRFRFGDGTGAKLSHMIVVAFALLNVIGFLAYGFTGIGKFTATFLPWQFSADPATNDNIYGLIVTGITTLYVIKGGMFSVVATELLQFVIMTVACLWVGFIAISQVAPGAIDAFVPQGWHDLFFGWSLNMDWSGIMDSANQKIIDDGWTLFGPFVMMMLFKGYLQAGAGPNPNYDMQRVLSTKSPREAAKMSWLVNVVLLLPRYVLITGLTVLALAFFSDELRAMGDRVDFELILPFTLREFIPVGLFGILIAALLAAFMSTYSATVNSAPAYIVNDVYRRYIRPDASQKTLVRMSYLVSILVVLIGTAVGLYVRSLNDLVQWIVAALWGGYTASNVLKWYWWRFNSYGYFWGMMVGLIAAGLVPGLMTGVADIYAFPVILAISLAGCIAGTLLTPPDDEDVLVNFYVKVRPWGFWKPIYEKAAARYPDLEPNRDFGRDMFNIVVGIAWQTAITATGIFLVLRDYTSLAISVAVIVVTSLILKYSWFNRLKDYPDVHAEQATALVGV